MGACNGKQHKPTHENDDTQTDTYNDKPRDSESDTSLNDSKLSGNQLSGDQPLVNQSLVEVQELEKLFHSSLSSLSLDSIDGITKDRIIGLLESLKQREQKEQDEMNLKDVDNVVSTSNIEKIVNELLADKNINIKCLPDFIEKKMYVNIFTLALGILAKTAQTAKIELLGHEISLRFKEAS